MVVQSFTSLLRVVALLYVADAFGPHVLSLSSRRHATAAMLLQQTSTTASFIDTELRGAAMRLHTREQAPKEGEAPSEKKPTEPYVTTHADYLRFLVDSQHVYQAFEDIVNERDDLQVFRDTGLERTKPLETDIEYMMQEYKLQRPTVGKAGRDYAELLRTIESVPEFVCHYYNFYFAHTAGGRMIGTYLKTLVDGLIECREVSNGLSHTSISVVLARNALCCFTPQVNK